MARRILKGESRPVTAAFRQWLTGALQALELNPSQLSLELNLGRNYLGAFMHAPSVGQPGKDIPLELAHVLACDLGRRAEAKGMELPAAPVTFELEGAGHG